MNLSVILISINGLKRHSIIIMLPFVTVPTFFYDLKFTVSNSVYSLLLTTPSRFVLQGSPVLGLDKTTFNPDRIIDRISSTT